MERKTTTVRKYHTIDELPAAFTVRDLMDFMQISKASAYNMVNRKGFPCIRYGERDGCFKIMRDHFAIWLEQEVNR